MNFPSEGHVNIQHDPRNDGDFIMAMVQGFGWNLLAAACHTRWPSPVGGFPCLGKKGDEEAVVFFSSSSLP